MGKKKKRGKKRREEKAQRKISWNYIFSYGNNLAINSLIVVFLFALAFFIIFHQRQLSLGWEPIEKEDLIDSHEVEIEKIKADMNNWEKYQNLWYGFELKYPENWNKPIEQTAPTGSNWEYRYAFRKKDPSQIENACVENSGQSNIADWPLSYAFYKKEVEKNNPYNGFDVIVYSVEKIKELSKTDEFPLAKNAELKATGACDQIAGHLLENKSYPAERIYIPLNDDCYEPAFFYSLTREKYIYNIVPVLKEELAVTVDPEKETINNFSEFFSIVSGFNLIDIKRPKPKPRITAPKPIAATKTVNGRRVCAKKNDHPGKSKQGKSKHLDMECCLDPDEYPNPWCYYPPEKYGKYLK